MNWNVDKFNARLLGNLLDDLSSNYHWDVVTFQELNVSPELCEGEDFRSETSPPVFSVPGSLLPSEIPPAVTPPRKHASVPELHTPMRHVLISNCSDFHAAVAVHQTHGDMVRWRGTCRFATLIALGTPARLCMSMYLPNPGRGLGLYLEAIDSVCCLLRSLPADLRVAPLFIGCDANCSLASHPDMSDIVGPRTYVQGNDKRAEAFLNVLLEFKIRACNTFGDVDIPFWTLSWYGDSSVRKQIDFVLAPIGLETSCEVDYRLDCRSDHRPIVCKASAPLPSPARKHRARGTKGWKPLGDAAAQSFREKTNSLSPSDSPSAISERIVSAALSVPFSTHNVRSAERNPAEPPHVLEIRALLAVCSCRDERLRLGKLLYRRRRNWLRWVAKRRFAAQALSLGRTDRATAGKVSWLSLPGGERSYDMQTWASEIVQPFYSALFTSKLETHDEKYVRLASLESALAASRLDGSSKKIHLPAFLLLETRSRMLPNKAAGQDGIVAEMLKSLDCPALDAIRVCFENRLNGVEGFTEQVASWNTILVHCIPKCRAANEVSKWRPISLISCLAKWYLACLSRLLGSHTRPPTCCLLGFVAGRQPMELTELCRLLLQRFNEWGLPLYIGRGDVSKAFDELEHPLLDAALAHRHAPLALRVATLRELVGIALEIHLQGVVTDPVLLGKGGKQGGPDTPGDWNYLLDFALKDVVSDWLRVGWGADLGDGNPISHAIWADDIFFFAVSLDQVSGMAQDLTYALNDHGLSWKPGSLAFLANKVAASALTPPSDLGFPTLDRQGNPWWYPRVETMPCLGVLLTPSGDSLAAVEHRITAGQQHYWARDTQLTCRAVPKRSRTGRLYSTVGSTILWGAGGWTLSRALLSRLETVELSLLRRVFAVPRCDEGFVGYMKKSARVVRESLSAWGYPGLAVLVLSRLHGWAGHLARLPKDLPISRVLRWRNLEWWRSVQDTMERADPGNVSKWRHNRPGRFPRWEEPLERFDTNWFHLAQDRDTWRSLRGAFIASELVHLGARNYCPRSLRTPSAPLPLPGHVPAVSGSSCPFPSLLSVSSSGPSLYCRALPSHLDLRVMCLGERTSVQPCILGLSSAPDSSASEICARALRLLRQIATRTHTRVSDVLAYADTESLASVRHLAVAAHRTSKSDERRMRWPKSVSLSHIQSVRAFFSSDRSDLGLGGVGVSVEVGSGASFYEVFCSRIFLGETSSASACEFQAAGIAILALLSAVSWLGSHL